MKNKTSLFLDLYELTMAQSYFVYKKETSATFDLFVRGLPKNRAYLVACGLADILEYLKKLKFGRSDIEYLRGLGIFSEEFLGFLKSFRFKGDIYAVREGEILFANEPILRITGSIIEAQLIETFLLNTINLQTMIASKAARVVCAAGKKKVFDFALRRTHGYDAGVKVARCAYLAGFDGTSNCLAGALYRMPVAGTMAHSFVMSFKNEIDSFLAYTSIFPGNSVLLVDTYNSIKGVKNAIKAGLYLKERGYRLKGIRLDSGDIAYLSRVARRMLDSTGLGFVKIFASGNLDEFKIKKLLMKNAMVDVFGVGTNMGTSIDAPCLDVIYKISEVSDEKGNFFPTMKLSRAKLTYPGRKQIFRIKDKKGKFIKDILGLESENIEGEPLLKKVVENGKLVYKIPSLKETRSFLQKNLAQLPDDLRDIHCRYHYPVYISPKLNKLRRSLIRQLKDRQ